MSEVGTICAQDTNFQRLRVVTYPKGSQYPQRIEFHNNKSPSLVEPPSYAFWSDSVRATSKTPIFARPSARIIRAQHPIALQSRALKSIAKAQREEGLDN